MSFKKNTTTIINNDNEIFHTSFESVSNTISSTEVKSILPSPGLSYNSGYSVASGSGHIVVGSPGGGASGNGSFSIFTKDGTHVATTNAPAGYSFNFGISVAIGDGLVAVGDPENQTYYFQGGIVGVYDLNGVLKSYPTAYFTAPDISPYYNFGTSVAIGSGVIVVGAPGGINYNDDSTGNAYIYSYSPSGITNDAILEHPDAQDGAQFGHSVGVNDGIVAVGAVYAESSRGVAYLFNIRGSFLKRIVASDRAIADYFGWSIAVGNGIVVVGAPGDDDDGSDSGSVYLFDYSGSQIAKIKPSDGSSGKSFGRSVSVGSGRILVGARGDASSRGCAYLFNLSGTQLAKITASDGVAGDNFGESVSIREGRLVIGASSDDHSGYNDTGSAYIYKLSENHNIYFEKILDSFKF